MTRTSLLLATALLSATVFLGCTQEDPGGGAPPGGGGSGGGGGGSGGGGGVDECDLDGDGHRVTSCGGDDCNDRDDRVFPGAPEVCDGHVDENCSGGVDEGCECVPGDRRACFPPGLDAATRNVGACSDGQQSCDVEGRWDECTGAQLPGEEGAACDGVDQDCDGTADQGLVNDCGSCGELPREICGNGLDDDCDGVIDPGNVCNVHCGGVDLGNPQPPALACCFRDPDVAGLQPAPTPYSTACVEWTGLPGCSTDARTCLDLDGNPETVCEKRCTGTRCVCGLTNAAGAPLPDDGCGFETPCAFLDCDDRENQPCYSGPPATLGVGICRGGTASCSADPGTGERGWGSCEGQTLPGEELCGNRLDDDCDGSIDEEDGATGARCAVNGRCAPDATELCGNGEDDDCDGFADEGCRATGSQQACYTGPLGTRSRGVCADGLQANLGGFWGPCDGQTLPSPERCADGVDSDCDGLGAEGAERDDDGCCSPAGEESCNGVDDDCDGFVDEGVTSACGTCEEACYHEEFTEPATCTEGSGRTCSRIQADENDPDAFTLDNDKRGCGQAGAAYVAVTEIHELAKMDTLTGQKIWQVDTQGTYPSRTAIACDGSVWLGNRGYDNPENPRNSNVVHFDLDGNLICIAEITGLVRGVAIDSAGFVWIGTYNTLRLYKLSGSSTTSHPDGRDRCEIIDLAPADPNEQALVVGQNVYGLAIDQYGIAWTGSMPTVRVDTNNLTFEVVEHADTYGVAIDGQSNVWFGGPGLGIHRLNGLGPYVNRGVYEQTSTATGVYTVTVAHDGMVWGTDLGGNRIVRLDPTTMQHQSWPIPQGYGSSPHGIAEDEYGKMWTNLMSGGYSFRFDPDTQTFDAFEVQAGQSLYTYSDFTGTQLRQFVARQGSWVQTWDSLYPTTDWRSLTWSQRVPAGSSVQVFARFANSRNGLASTTTVCGPYSEPPVDLDACAGVDGNRFAAIEFLLQPNRDGAAPTVGDVNLVFTRP